MSWWAKVSKPTPVRSDRNPFQVWVVFTCFFSGLVAILPFGGTRSGVVDRFLPQFADLWYIGLLLSGTVCLAAALLRQRHTGLLTERVGLTLLAGQLAGYGVALLILKTPIGILFVGLAIACLVRIRQAARELRALREAIHAVVVENEEQQ